jgi:serine/threonine protein kinase
MGVVYSAEQFEPVRRIVAVKIIKPGMDTERVIARFHSERQALALMDHPSIAKVLDAGATASGRPYFVMELVEGVPITSYCDEHHNFAVWQGYGLVGYLLDAGSHYRLWFPSPAAAKHFTIAL